VIAVIIEFMFRHAFMVMFKSAFTLEITYDVFKIKLPVLYCERFVIDLLSLNKVSLKVNVSLIMNTNVNVSSIMNVNVNGNSLKSCHFLIYCNVS